MKAVITYYEKNRQIEGGIFSLTRKEAEKKVTDENIINYVPLLVIGKTYAEKKADLYSKAVILSDALGVYSAWSYGELLTIQDFLEANAKRYGLLQEFRENGLL